MRIHQILQTFEKWPLIRTFIKFLISGGLNFVFSYLIYLLCLKHFAYSLSYSIAYISGIACSYFMNKRFVFKSKYTPKQLILFPLIYVFQYLMGLALGMIWVEVMHLNPQWIPIVTTLLCIPPTFVLMRCLFGLKNK